MIREIGQEETHLMLCLAKMQGRLLGMFGQVQDGVLCGGQSIVHLTKSPVYQNGTSASVYKTCY
jgi:hypothetical protein